MTHNQQPTSEENQDQKRDESLRKVQEVLEGTATQAPAIPGDILPEGAGSDDLEREDEWRPADAAEENQPPRNSA